jgi:hypothetical protein
MRFRGLLFKLVTRYHAKPMFWLYVFANDRSTLFKKTNRWKVWLKIFCYSKVKVTWKSQNIKNSVDKNVLWIGNTKIYVRNDHIDFVVVR